MRQITFALDAAPLSRNYHRPVDYNTRFIAEAVLSNLIPEPTGDDRRRPGSLAHFQRIGDGSAWLLQLRERRWSDGSELTSDDILHAWRRDGARRARRLSAFIGGSGIRRLRRLDKRTVRLDFRHPVAHFPAMLGLPELAPEHTAGSSVQSLGPFVVDRYEKNRIWLNRSEYWTDSRPPESLSFAVVPSENVALAKFAAQELQVTSTTGFSQQALDRLGAHPGLRSQPLPITGQLDFGQRAPLFVAEPSARLRLSALLDRGAMTAPAPRLVRPLPQVTGDRRANDAIDDELAEALRSCATIGYADFPPNDAIVRCIIQQVHDKIGVRLTGEALSYPEYVARASSREYGMLYSLVVTDFAHPAARLMPWHSKSAAARHRSFADEELDRRLDAASSAEADERALWEHAQHRWSEVMPVISLVQVVANYLVCQEVVDLPVTAAGLVAFDQL